MAKYYLYVLKHIPTGGSHRDRQWYVGMTNDYDRRLIEHKSGNGAQCLKGRTIVDDYNLGSDEEKQYIKDLENNLTEAIAKEYGWGSVMGGGFLKCRSANLPDTSNSYLALDVAAALKETGDPELEKVADHTRATLEVTSSLEFTTEREAREWADRFLPDGTLYKVDIPVVNTEAYISDRDRLTGSN